jgi:molecular chaperone GrpE
MNKDEAEEIIQDELEELKEVAEFPVEPPHPHTTVEPVIEEYKDDDTEVDDVTFVDSDEDGTALPTKDIVKKLREDLKQARKEKEEYLTGWQRAKADYVNLQKDEEQKRKDLRAYITTGLVEDILPAFDSFDMAMANKEAWQKVDANWRSGVEYIQQQLLKALENYGVEKVGKVGEPFNPNLHEAIENIPADNTDQDHTIASVIQSGYKMGDKVIRPARVNVFALK